MGAYATDYVERTWPLGYRGTRRVPYPAEGNKEVYSIARPAGGYLWDRAAAKGVRYRSYGEFVKNGPRPTTPRHQGLQVLEGHFDPKFRGFDLSDSDLKRPTASSKNWPEFEKARARCPA